MNLFWITSLLNHKAINGWNGGAFWFGTSRPMRAPGILVMLTFAFYISSAVIALSVLLFHLAGFFGVAGKPMTSLAFFLNDNPDSLWISGSRFVSFVILSFISMNTALVVLDIAITKIFIRENITRFVRAGTGAGLLSIMHILGANVAEHYQIVDAGWTKSGFSLAAVMALAFLALSAAFAEGMRMKAEQDLTV